MSQLPPCPSCRSSFTYEDGTLLVCPECGHEWTSSTGESVIEASAVDALIVLDANGVPLANGDSVVVVKDLKVKGAASALKIGTRVRSIRLVEGDHNIDCRIDGFGAMQLKSAFVKKA